MKKFISVVIALFLLISLNLPIFSAYYTTTYSMLSDHLALCSGSSGVCFLSYHCGDCHIERLTPDAGSSDLHLNHSISAAAVFGNTAVALCNDVTNNQLEVYTYRYDTDVLESFSIDNYRYYTDVGFYYDSSGIYLVSDRSADIIEQYNASGTLVNRYTFNSAVTQLGSDYNCRIFAVSAKTLYRLNGKQFNALSGSGVSSPVTWFSGDLLSDAVGKVYRIQNDSCMMLFQCDANVGKANACIVDQVVYYPCGNQIFGYRVSSGEKCFSISLNSAISDLYAYRGYIYAVSNSGKPSVVRIHPDEFTDLTPRYESTQSPESQDSPDNDQQNEPDYLIASELYDIDFNTYRISGIPAGTTFAQLKKNIRHDGYTMSLYRDGKQKKSGNCGTAMTVVFDSDRATYTFELSVNGDITGEGNVNSRDLNILMEYLIDTYDFNGVYTLSADLSGDGIVDVKDLALLHRMF